MAAYPTFSPGESFESSVDHRVGTLVDFTESGEPAGRDLGNSRKAFFRLVYPSMSSVDLLSLHSHYAANSEADFSFTSKYSGSAHTCRYMSPPKSRKVAPERHLVTVELFEVS